MENAAVLWIRELKRSENNAKIPTNAKINYKQMQKPFRSDAMIWNGYRLQASDTTERTTNIVPCLRIVVANRRPIYEIEYSRTKQVHFYVVKIK